MRASSKGTKSYFTGGSVFEIKKIIYDIGRVLQGGLLRAFSHRCFQEMVEVAEVG